MVSTRVCETLGMGSNPIVHPTIYSIIIIILLLYTVISFIFRFTLDTEHFMWYTYSRGIVMKEYTHLSIIIEESPA